MKEAKVIPLTFQLKPYRKNELRELYGVTKYMMDKWMKDIQDQLGKRIGRYYTIPQVQVIIKNYGTPGQIIKQAA